MSTFHMTKNENCYSNWGIAKRIVGLDMTPAFKAKYALMHLKKIAFRIPTLAPTQPVQSAVRILVAVCGQLWQLHHHNQHRQQYHHQLIKPTKECRQTNQRETDEEGPI